MILLGVIPQLEYVYGSCSKSINSFADATHSINAHDDMECYQKCKDTIGCYAFSYDYNEEYSFSRGNDCDLFSGGPYQTGTYRANTKCYTMPNGKCFKGQ